MSRTDFDTRQTLRAERLVPPEDVAHYMQQGERMADGIVESCAMMRQVLAGIRQLSRMFGPARWKDASGTPRSGLSPR